MEKINLKDMDKTISKTFIVLLVVVVVGFAFTMYLIAVDPINSYRSIEDCKSGVVVGKEQYTTSYMMYIEKNGKT